VEVMLACLSARGSAREGIEEAAYGKGRSRARSAWSASRPGLKTSFIPAAMASCDHELGAEVVGEPFAEGIHSQLETVGSHTSR
jgi:hypothetical protein